MKQGKKSLKLPLAMIYNQVEGGNYPALYVVVDNQKGKKVPAPHLQRLVEEFMHNLLSTVNLISLIYSLLSLGSVYLLANLALGALNRIKRWIGSAVNQRTKGACENKMDSGSGKYLCEQMDCIME